METAHVVLELQKLLGFHHLLTAQLQDLRLSLLSRTADAVHMVFACVFFWKWGFCSNMREFRVILRNVCGR